MEFVKIPIEFFKIKELNNTDILILSVYKYFTEEGDYHCCSLTNKQICDMLNICLKTIKSSKYKLRRLGYIETKGIKVRYLGVGKVEDATHKEEKTEKPKKPTLTIEYMKDKLLLFAYAYEREYNKPKD